MSEVYAYNVNTHGILDERKLFVPRQIQATGLKSRKVGEVVNLFTTSAVFTVALLVCALYFSHFMEPVQNRLTVVLAVVAVALLVYSIVSARKLFTVFFDDSNLVADVEFWLHSYGFEGERLKDTSGRVVEFLESEVSAGSLSSGRMLGLTHPKERKCFMVPVSIEPEGVWYVLSVAKSYKVEVDVDVF